MESNSDEAQIKLFIENNPGCTMDEIIQGLGLDPQVVIEIIKKFKKNGILTTKRAKKITMF
jgi:DNA-binding MarR family transcriptional regulator